MSEGTNMAISVTFAVDRLTLASILSLTELSYDTTTFSRQGRVLHVSMHEVHARAWLCEVKTRRRQMLPWVAKC